MDQENQPGTGGLNAFFLLVDKPEVYNLPSRSGSADEKSRAELVVYDRRRAGNVCGGPGRGHDVQREGRLSHPDGRFIDPSLGMLLGEGSQQLVHQRGKPPGPMDVWYEVPRATAITAPNRRITTSPQSRVRSGSGPFPRIFFVGGVAGAAMVLGFATQLAADGRLGTFKRRCRWVGAIGGGVGSALLILDLGRKSAS